MTAKEGLIYHYCPSEAFLSIIEKNELWLTEVSKTNDSTEGKNFIENVKKFVETKKGRFHWIPRTGNYGMDVLDKYIKSVWICCFSENSDQLSQWCRYADDGKGFSIGFDKDILSDLPSNRNSISIANFKLLWPLSLNEIKYARSTKWADITNFINWCNKNPENSGINGDASKFFSDFKLVMAFMSFIYKDYSFMEEKEWRLICHMKGSKFDEVENFLNNYCKAKSTTSKPELFSSNEVHFRSTPKGIVHYLKMRIPRNAIKHVLLGPKNLSDKEDIRMLLSKYKRVPEGMEVEDMVEKTKIPYC